MKISFVLLRVNIHEWDDKNRILNAIDLLLKDIDRKKIKINNYKDKGLISNIIEVYEIKINDKNSIDIFFRNLISLGLRFEDIKSNCNFDENYNIYLRIDKDELTLNKIIKIHYTEDSFLLKISFDYYKKDKEIVLNYLNEYLENINKKFLHNNI
jgi:RNA binding exosome subunit